jgi:hypothetical protein
VSIEQVFLPARHSLYCLVNAEALVICIPFFEIINSNFNMHFLQKVIRNILAYIQEGDLRVFGVFLKFLGWGSLCKQNFKMVEFYCLTLLSHFYKQAFQPMGGGAGGLYQTYFYPLLPNVWVFVSLIT